ncbi:hypothetical protein KK141_19480 [Dyella sp. LX-66]|uniref:hypothetical protein n=1 Tax=unclassified Dyella TaxID=2634549 RepID=UPI001BDF8EA9|nr:MULTISPECIES: hypothetical protein [unclassified Dyella]MBT2119545.1 hypothetical protein [Dyella sp. LX-1]MBT2141739.1 hypothetical protein [Dyella sp. LX-66]
MIAPDFTSISAGLDAGPVIALILIGGTIVVGIGFGIWTSGSVARFFSGAPSDPMKDKSSPEYRAAWEERMRRETEELKQYNREHPEPQRSRQAASTSTRAPAREEGGYRDDGPGIADFIASGALSSLSTSTSSSSDSTSSDFSGGGGDFGGGGSSGEW